MWWKMRQRHCFNLCCQASAAAALPFTSQAAKAHEPQEDQR
jgi:hypothetical protein